MHNFKHLGKDKRHCVSVSVIKESNCVSKFMMMKKSKKRNNNVFRVL